MLRHLIGLSAVVFCAGQAAFGQTVKDATWDATTGSWSQTAKWTGLGGSDPFHDNNATWTYNVSLPGTGSPYPLGVDRGPINLLSISLASQATLLLNSSDFSPGAITNGGVIELREDELRLTQNVVNDGQLRFDTDTGTEYMYINSSLTLSGTGKLLFPETGSVSISHQVVLNGSSVVLTNGAGHTIEGGSGQIRRSNSNYLEAFVNDGLVRANLGGRMLQFYSDYRCWTMTNDNLMTAEAGGILSFFRIGGLLNNGTLTCDASSTLDFFDTNTVLGGTVNCDGLLKLDGGGGLTLTAAGSGVGEYRQISGSTTYTSSASLEFGQVNLQAGSITVSSNALVRVINRYTHSLTTESNHVFAGTGGLRVSGGAGGNPCVVSTLAQVEVAGTDKLTDPSGWTNNFQIPKLIIGPGAKVALVDLVNNGNRNGPGGAAEALYVDVLEFQDGYGRLVLNALHLYYNILIGNPDQIGLGGDCNSNGVPDECDIAQGTSDDCNGNHVPDECDVPPLGTGPDCNSNGIPDSCDIADCPPGNNACADCNNNGVPDACDIAAGCSLDLNNNGIPDECEEDCNLNGIPDDQDIANGTSEDCDGGGMPDECQTQFPLFTWVGPNNGSFMTAANWNPAGVPGGDAELVNTTATDNTCVLNLSRGEKKVCALTVGATGAGKQTLQINGWATLRATAGTAINSGGQIKLTGGGLDAGGIAPADVTVAAGGRLFGAGTVGAAVVNAGVVESYYGELALTGESLTNASGATLRATAGRLLDVRCETVTQQGQIDVRSNATMLFAGELVNQSEASISLMGGTLAAAGGLSNLAAIDGFGTLEAEVDNDSGMTFIADSQIVGDTVNYGTITIQNGTLTFAGNLTNNGTIIGDFSGKRGDPELPRSAGDGSFVQGNYVASATASLLMPSAEAVVGMGGHFDVAINNSAAYNMVQAELKMVGMGAQTLELMSVDIGPDPAGLNRGMAGHYPIGTLRIGPSATTVTLVDNHDNDGLGQGSCEAIYVNVLRIEAGAALDNPTCKIYYNSLVNNGTVTYPANLVKIGGAILLGDLNCDGQVNTGDIGPFALALTDPAGYAGSYPSCDIDLADMNEDTLLNGRDVQGFVAALLNK